MHPLLVEQIAAAAEGAAKTQSSLRDVATPLPDAAALVTSFNSMEPEADFVSPKALGRAAGEALDLAATTANECEQFAATPSAECEACMDMLG